MPNKKRTPPFPDDDAEENSIPALTPLHAFTLASLVNYTTIPTNRLLPTSKELHQSMPIQLEMFGRKKPLTLATLETTLRELRARPWQLISSGPDPDRPLDNDSLVYRAHQNVLQYPLEAFLVLAIYNWQRREPNPITLTRLKHAFSTFINSFLPGMHSTLPEDYESALTRITISHYIKMYRPAACPLCNREFTVPTNDEETFINYLPRTHAEIRYIRLLLPYLLDVPMALPTHKN